MDESHSTVKELKVSLGDCCSKIEELTLKCVTLEIVENSRLNNAEIQGVPECRDENVVHTVTNIARALGVELNIKDIDACHRLGKRAASRILMRKSENSKVIHIETEKSLNDVH